MLASNGGNSRFLLRIAALCLAALAALFAAACGNDDPGPQSPPAADGGGVAVSCNALSNLDAYRYRVTVKFLSPTATPTPSPEASPDSAETPGSEPLSAYIQALSALFADFTLEGAYLSPDRSQSILRFENEELELRAVEDEAWVRVGNSWQRETSGDAELLTPVVICEEIVLKIAPLLTAADSTKITLNGIETRHYHLTQADLAALGPLAGTQPGTEYEVDLWLADSAHFPMQLRIVSAQPSDPAGVNSYQLFMEIRDINDRGIRIERPVP
jgi:hypothetical protein